MLGPLFFLFCRFYFEFSFILKYSEIIYALFVGVINIKKTRS